LPFRSHLDVIGVGKSGGYIWVWDIDRHALEYRGAVSDFYGDYRTAPSQYPADDENRITVDTTLRLRSLDIASPKQLGIHFAQGNIQYFD
jgi:hypothetical protein